MNKKSKEESESEFGKGLVICLVKFAEHFGRWPEFKETYKQLREKNKLEIALQKLQNQPGMFSESEVVKIFFNGASDHLYEIEVPKEWKNTKIGKKVSELKNLCLDIGHDFYHNEKYSEADVFKAYDLCREIALLIDKKIGLDPELGKW